MRKIKEYFFKYYPPIVISIIGACLVLLIKNGNTDKLLISFIGFFAGSYYFIHKQKLEEIKLFKELFTEFNKRYDDLNDDLTKIIDGPDKEEFNQHKKMKVIDYFNLCAEEYFFYKRGYIPSEVWINWRNGIKEKFSSQHIKEVWEQEKQNGSYYGLNKILRNL